MKWLLPALGLLSSEPTYDFNDAIQELKSNFPKTIFRCKTRRMQYSSFQPFRVVRVTEYFLVVQSYVDVPGHESLSVGLLDTSDRDITNLRVLVDDKSNFSSLDEGVDYVFNTAINPYESNLIDTIDTIMSSCHPDNWGEVKSPTSKDQRDFEEALGITRNR